MNTTYADFVSSRFKNGPETLQDLQKASEMESQLLHISLGLVGELGEYRHSETRENMLEELGDFGFYLQAAANLLGVNISRSFVFDKVAGFAAAGRYCMLLDFQVNEILDIVKKTVIYRKDLSLQRLKWELQTAYEYYVAICEFHGTTPQELQQANMEKLTKRYPTTYSNADANARADKA